MGYQLERETPQANYTGARFGSSNPSNFGDGNQVWVVDDHVNGGARRCFRRYEGAFVGVNYYEAELDARCVDQIQRTTSSLGDAHYGPDVKVRRDHRDIKRGSEGFIIGILRGGDLLIAVPGSSSGEWNEQAFRVDDLEPLPGVQLPRR